MKFYNLNRNIVTVSVKKREEKIKKQDRMYKMVFFIVSGHCQLIVTDGMEPCQRDVEIRIVEKIIRTAANVLLSNFGWVENAEMPPD